MCAILPSGLWFSRKELIVIAGLGCNGAGAFFVDKGSNNLLISASCTNALSSFCGTVGRRSVGLSSVACILTARCRPSRVNLVDRIVNRGIGLLLVSARISFIRFSSKVFRESGELRCGPVSVGGTAIVHPRRDETFLGGLKLGNRVIDAPDRDRSDMSLILSDNRYFINSLRPVRCLSNCRLGRDLRGS